MKDDYQVDDLVYSFYNSLTLCFAELYGRYYGGGVLELTPNEFKKLPLPYFTITARDFNSFAKRFKQKDAINDICKVNDIAILKSAFPGLDNDVISKLYLIREKLFKRRMKIY